MSIWLGRENKSSPNGAPNHICFLQPNLPATPTQTNTYTQKHTHTNTHPHTHMNIDWEWWCTCNDDDPNLLSCSCTSWRSCKQISWFLPEHLGRCVAGILELRLQALRKQRTLCYVHFNSILHLLHLFLLSSSCVANSEFIWFIISCVVVFVFFFLCCKLTADS